MNTPGSPPSFPAAPAGFQQVPVGTYAPPPGPPPTSSTNYAPPPGPPPGCPPDYFDISIIPTGNIMLAKDCPPLGERSNAKFEVKDSSIVSFDPSLQKNVYASWDMQLLQPEELWKFFLSHLSKPTLLVHILGQHEETYTEVVHGDNGTRVETRSRTVTDFSFNFDVSHYIAPAWSRVVCIPKQGKPSQNYRQALEEFTFSSNIFKEIHMVKQVFWDYPSLTNAIVSAIRRTGYPHRIMVSYPLKNAKIWVFSDHPLSKMAHNTCVNVLCVLTCMCIIFWPILALSSKLVSSVAAG
ncbi:uncharacterized protein BJ171DRAFT_437614 [Polychytrium aggregatum]|uniref:uncharacterized protein n=1 Tax=Polychytrium aggregatum TaxID=110093 RepID=UPI0022FF455D|nr:uncharacterized protein BJ171DRAFT_437614 [Polychytrium aggregatum]KAI9208892.1 hypothetical protein BJ171DRAFT_437614 [Polychytrium aggregatum]